MIRQTAQRTHSVGKADAVIIEAVWPRSECSATVAAPLLCLCVHKLPLSVVRDVLKGNTFFRRRISTNKKIGKKY